MASMYTPNRLLYPPSNLSLHQASVTPSIKQSFTQAYVFPELRKCSSQSWFLLVLYSPFVCPLLKPFLITLSKLFSYHELLNYLKFYFSILTIPLKVLILMINSRTRTRNIYIFHQYMCRTQ